ncbi:MAG: hypothetical protein JWR15_1196, partial [Prosthecobacter sp.]|nr:hypothetical protein [Prosthecobacter sp.]
MKSAIHSRQSEDIWGSACVGFSKNGLVTWLYQKHAAGFDVNHGTTMKYFFAVALLLFASSLFGEVRLPAVISDHMVLQAGKLAALWGWGDAGEEVAVEFAGQKKTAKANRKGEWQVKLDSLVPNVGGGDLRINDKVVHDVLVGEVWLASGQSNMEMRIKDKLHGLVDNADAEMAAAKHPEIRVFVHDEP